MNYLEEEFYQLISTNRSVFNFIQNTALDGLWYVDLENPGNQWMNTRFWVTLGYKPDAVSRNRPAWEDLVFPDDLQRVIENFENHCQDSTHPYDQEIRYRHKNGTTIWMHSRGMAIRNAEGKPVRMLGAHNNITELKNKEETLERCNTAARIGSWELDLLKNTLSWSNTTRALHEVPPGYVPEPQDMVLFFKEGDSRKQAREAMARAIKQHRAYDLELELITKTDRPRWVKFIGFPEVVKDRCIRIYGTIQDIHDNRITLQQLSEVTERLKLATSTSLIGIWDYHIETDTLVWDDVMYELYGVPRQRFAGTHDAWKAVLHPDDREPVLNEVKRALAGEKDFDAVFRILKAGGKIHYIKGRGTVQRDHTGKAIRMLGTNWDVTLQKQAEIEVEQISQSNRIFIRQAPTSLAMFDRDMRYIAASEKWMEDYNLLEVSLPGRSLYDVFPRITDEWKQIHRECMEGISHKREEDRVTWADGSVHWLKWEVKPWYDESGLIGGLIMYTEDITAKKEIEEQLQISEQAFHGNFDNAAIGMALINDKGEWMKVNRKVSQIIGYTEEELKRLSFKDITHPDDLDADLALLQELTEGKRANYQMEKRYMHKNGQVVYVIWAVSAVRNNAGNILYFISQVIDITELKTVERGLAELLKKNQGILDASTEVSIITTDRLGVINTFNRGAEKLLGYQAHEIINQHSAALFHLPEELIKRSRELTVEYGREITGIEVFIAKAREGLAETREWTYVRKDGTTFPVQLTLTAIEVDKEITGYLGIAIDISKTKRAEKENQSLLSVTQEQNTRLRNFAHIVSHNLRSHSGNISFLLEILINERPELEHLEVVMHLRNASQSLQETIAHLNEVALINTSVIDNLQRIGLAEYVGKAISSVAAFAFSSKVEIINEVKPEDEALAFPAYMDSIILNFLTNAIKYHAEERKSFVKITTARTNEYLVLSFEDNGLGIDLERYGAKLFGMYNTFHANKESRGIGLFITKNQVEAMGGRVEVESAVGRGSVFRIFLRVEKN